MSIMHVFLSVSGYGTKIFAIILLLGSVWFHNLLEVLVRDYSTLAVITMMIVMLTGTIAIQQDSVKRSHLMLGYLITLWLASGVGIYLPMPRTRKHLVTLDQLLVLDQLAPLAGAMISTIWS